MTINLVRVEYGKKGQEPALREYRINGVGSVGTLAEMDEMFPGETFVIKDNIEK